MITKTFLATGVSAVAFTSTAAAATAIEPDGGTLLDLAKPLLEAVMHGHWALGAALALVLLVAAARKYGSGYLPFLKGSLGTIILTFAGAFGGALATAFAAGSAVSGSLLWTALGVALAASGGWKVVAELVEALQPWIAKLPKWAQQILELALWAFRKPGALEIASAEAAGAAAVEASPSNGIAGIAGKPVDFP